MRCKGMNRRTARGSATVAHHHRVGDDSPVSRISELAFLRGEPKAILEWIDLGGVRTPICVDLERAKLSGDPGRQGRHTYSGITVDPRADDLGPT